MIMVASRLQETLVGRCQKKPQSAFVCRWSMGCSYHALSRGFGTATETNDDARINKTENSTFLDSRCSAI